LRSRPQCKQTSALLLFVASQPWQTQIDANSFDLPCMVSDLSGRTAAVLNKSNVRAGPIQSRNGHLERWLSWRSVQFAAGSGTRSCVVPFRAIDFRADPLHRQPHRPSGGWHGRCCKAIACVAVSAQQVQ
jgi:hypothetical protein